VIIFAKRSEDLPIVRRIGDLVRIHRANAKMYKDIKQFNVNVFYNSSWCLFTQQFDLDDDNNVEISESDEDAN
jgi:hypothetical protein